MQAVTDILEVLRRPPRQLGAKYPRIAAMIAATPPEEMLVMVDAWVLAKAADEIDRLRAALDDECTAHQVCVEMRDNADAEIERLRSEIEQYRERLGLP